MQTLLMSACVSRSSLAGTLCITHSLTGCTIKSPRELQKFYLSMFPGQETGLTGLQHDLVSKGLEAHQGLVPHSQPSKSIQMFY